MTQAGSGRRIPGDGCRERASSGGYSVVEVLAVVAIIAIMIAIALPSMFTGRRIYAVDDASNQLIDILQVAQQRALGDRQVMRVEITPGTDTVRGTIRIIDQNLLSAGVGDDVVIRDEVLPDNRDTTLNTSASLFPLPPSPHNFNHWTWVTTPLVIYFLPDGTVTSNPNTPTIVPQSLTLTVYVPLSPGVPDRGLTRAVTLFGPTGSIRGWQLNAVTDQFEEI